MTKKNEIDPRLQALINQTSSRRRFLGRGAMVLGGVAMGPTLLAACGSSSKTASGSATTSTAFPTVTVPATGSLRISNWPLYIGTDPSTVAAFQTATGITVEYQENYNDNEEWFAKNKDPLSQKQDIGADLVVPSEFMVARLIALGWLNQLNDANIPNKSNVRADLANADYDPGRHQSLPWMSGMVGLAVNTKAVTKPVTSIDDLFDPAYKGKVSMLADVRDGLGMILLSQGNSPADPSTESMQKAVDLVKEQKDKGQIRRFTGNDYSDDLTSGNVVIAQAYSGDVAQLQKDNPNLQFVVPDSGTSSFSDNMVIPYTTKNQRAAEEWMNWIYDRDNYAALVAQVQYIPVLSDMVDALAKVDPSVASNPLINPPQSTLDKLVAWKTLTDAQEQEYAQLMTAVTGG